MSRTAPDRKDCKDRLYSQDIYPGVALYTHVIGFSYWGSGGNKGIYHIEAPEWDVGFKGRFRVWGFRV